MVSADPRRLCRDLAADPDGSDPDQEENSNTSRSSVETGPEGVREGGKEDGSCYGRTLADGTEALRANTCHLDPTGASVRARRSQNVPEGLPGIPEAHRGAQRLQEAVDSSEAAQVASWNCPGDDQEVKGHSRRCSLVDPGPVPTRTDTRPGNGSGTRGPPPREGETTTEGAHGAARPAPHNAASPRSKYSPSDRTRSSDSNRTPGISWEPGIPRHAVHREPPEDRGQPRAVDHGHRWKNPPGKARRSEGGPEEDRGEPGYPGDAGSC